jgi:RTX calcium-binding nonapeptide repeat (4 copies)
MTMRPSIRLVLIAGALAAVAGAPPAAEARIDPVVVGTTLFVRGDAEDDSVTLRPSATQPGVVEVVRPGAVTGFDRSAFKSISVEPGPGGDVVVVDDPLTKFTGAKPTTVSGGTGDDRIDGGGASERITGGPGDDTMRGGAGSDTFPWVPGDGDDVIDGGAADDVLLFSGSNAPERIAVRPSTQRPGGVRVFRDVASISQEAVSLESILVESADGDDEVTVLPGLQNTSVTVDGGPGSDNLLGTDGSQALHGAGGADTVRGGDADDQVTGGAGDDAVCGGPGDDIVAGEDGADRLSGDGGEDVIRPDALDVITAACTITAGPPALPADPEFPPAAEPAPTPAPNPGPAPSPAPAPAPAPKPVGRGFGTAKVKATAKGLVVTVKNTSATSLALTVAGTESGSRYRAIKRTVAAGKRATFTLAAPKKLRAALAKALTKRGKVVRKPKVTVASAMGAVKVRPRLVVRSTRR